MHIIKDILTYPFRGGGKYILLIGVILTLAGNLVSIAPLVGGIAGLLLYAYFCAVYFKLIESTSTGGTEAPDYPDISNFFEDVIWPMLQITFILLLSFGPFAIYAYRAGEEMNPLISGGLLILGIVYFPMALLAAVILGRLSAAGPHVVFPSIFRAGWYYLLAVGILVLIYGAEMACGELLEEFFIIKYLVMAVVSMYAMMANARTLGLVFRDRREELNWI